MARQVLMMWIVTFGGLRQVKVRYVPWLRRSTQNILSANPTVHHASGSQSPFAPNALQESIHIGREVVAPKYCPTFSISH